MRHRVNECRKLERRLRKNMLVEEEPMNFTNNEDDLDKDGGVLHWDENTTLMIRLSILIPNGNLDEDKRHNSIFHSTCTIKDKIYSLIINNGSCENVVSIEAVQKL